MHVEALLANECPPTQYVLFSVFSLANERGATGITLAHGESECEREMALDSSHRPTHALGLHYGTVCYRGVKTLTAKPHIKYQRSASALREGASRGADPQPCA